MTNKIRCVECNKDFNSEDALASHNNSKHYKNHTSKGNKLSMKTIVIICIAIILLVGVILFAISNSNPPKVISGTGTGITTTPDLSNAQIVNMRVSGSKYILEPSTVKVNVPVKLVANIAQMPGCSKAVTVPAFNVFKYVDNNDNTIVFTPTKTGTFKVACSMNMYVGSLTITE